MRRITFVVVMALVSILSLHTAPRATALSATFGWLDTAQPYSDNVLSVSGWAMTSDYPQAALGVRIRVDSSTYFFPAGNYRLANLQRTDVGAAYPGYGNYHGFAFMIPMADGTHTVCAEAQNSGVYNDLSGCRTVTMWGTNGRYEGRLWPHHQGVVLWLKYNYHGASALRTGIDDGATSWNPATRVFLTDAQGAPSHITLSWQDFRQSPVLPADIVALTGNERCLSIQAPCNFGSPHFGGPIQEGVIFLDESEPLMTKSSAARRWAVAHEMGHALGLHHPPSPGVATIMAYSSDYPSDFDFGSINNAYP